MPAPQPCHVLYCEGWDPESGGPVGVVDTATASARDEAGARYALLVRDAAGAPLVLLEIACARTGTAGDRPR